MSARTILNPPVNTALVNISPYPIISTTVNASFVENEGSQFTVVFPVIFSSTDDVLYCAYSKDSSSLTFSVGTWVQNDTTAGTTSVAFVGSIQSTGSSSVFGIAIPYKN